jgi:II/X family phage/plasmid replication protein
MIDTVRLKSPYLCAEAAAIIEQQMILRMAVRMDADDGAGPLYMITSGELEGSFDNRIMVRLCREELAESDGIRASVPEDTRPRVDPRLLLHPNPAVQAERLRVASLGEAGRSSSRRHTKIFRNVPCPPYLVVEGSVHKAMVGHNITGGPQSFQPAACWFVNLIAAELLCVSLPHGSEWFVERVDVTETYHLPYEAIEDFIGSLNRVEYPRRKRRSYGVESLQFSGTTTSFSLYHKGPEFAVHDGKKLRGRVSPSELFDLQELANGIMRVEISVKAKKLRADAESGLLGVKGEKVRVVQVTDAYLQRVHDQEVARVIREGHKDMVTVRLEKEVSVRLFEMYGPQLAGSLYGLWVRLSSHGEKEVRKGMTRRTFYRQRKQLLDAGCSWAGTDIVIQHSSIPVGFSMRREDPRRDAFEDPKVTDLLARWREAA